MSDYPIDDRAWQSLFDALLSMAPAGDCMRLDALGHSRSDVDAADQHALKESFRDWCEANDVTLRAWMANVGATMTDAARDWLNARNDRCAAFSSPAYGSLDPIEPLARTLDDAARALGPAEPVLDRDTGRIRIRTYASQAR
jgi:hypothetical protein